jgi:hypothetical protein
MDCASQMHEPTTESSASGKKLSAFPGTTYVNCYTVSQAPAFATAKRDGRTKLSCIIGWHNRNDRLFESTTVSSKGSSVFFPRLNLTAASTLSVAHSICSWRCSKSQKAGN